MAAQPEIEAFFFTIAGVVFPLAFKGAQADRVIFFVGLGNPGAVDHRPSLKFRVRIRLGDDGVAEECRGADAIGKVVAQIEAVDPLGGNTLTDELPANADSGVILRSAVGEVGVLEIAVGAAGR